MSVIFDVERTPFDSGESGSFHATFDLYHFGRSVLGGLSSSTGRYVRSRRKASRDCLDAILIQLFLEGGVQFGVGQRTTYANAGDIVVFDLAQPVDNINQKFRHITSMWPRLDLEELVPDIARWHGLILPAKSPAVRLLREHMISSFDLASRLTPSQGRRVEDATLALVGAAMAGESLTEESADIPAMKELLAYRIKRHIRENLASSGLSPGQIARHFGISRRQLYSLMEPVGGISRYQLRLRLQRCLSDIQNADHAHRTISEIAYRWGFNNPSTFSRNFRSAFGITPGEARGGGGGLPALPEDIAVRSRAKRDLLREHHQWFHAIGV